MTTDTGLDFSNPNPEWIKFVRQDGKEVFSIDLVEGRLVPGDGLSKEEATQEMFRVMARAWPALVVAKGMEG